MRRLARTTRNPRSKPRTPVFRTVALAVFVALVASTLLLNVGCERRRERWRERWGRNDAKTAETTTSPSGTPRGARPPEIPGLTADAALRATVAAYSNAKFYADDAYFELVCDFDAQGRDRRTLRVPCSFAFAKPNFVRMEVGSGVLWSDGETVRAEILDEARAGRRLELPAPLLTSSIKELYPDAELAEAMDLRVSPTVFWAPPQAILTLAQDPLRTLVPEGARTRLLRPDYLRFVDATTDAETLVPCDRVEIDAEGGVRVFWLDRKTKGLVRVEFPLEGVAVPDDVERVAELRLEFPNQILSDVAPTDLSRFREPPRRPNEPNVSAPRSELAALASPPENADSGSNAKNAKNAKNADDADDADAPSDIRVVDRFLPPELATLGRPFPPVKARSLDAGLPDATLGRPRDDAKKTLVCFWSASLANASNAEPLSAVALREFAQTARYNADDARFAFLAVNVDPPEILDDAVRAEYDAQGATVPLFRLDRAATRAFDFPLVDAPALALLDERGVVQKFVREPLSFVALQRLLVRALDGGDLYNDDFNAYYADVKRFVEALEAADANDLYRVATQERESTPAAPPPRRYPKTFELREIWRCDELFAPTNPLAVSASDPDFDADRAFAPLENADAPDASASPDVSSDVSSDVSPAATAAAPALNNATDSKKSNASPQPTPPDAFVPLAVADALPSDLVVVPCDGNALALVDSQGRVVRKTTPAAAVGEPISFVRTVRFDGGRRYYVASSRLQSQKAHRFDKHFNDLGTLDVGKLQNQRVGDARFVDADGDGTPELALGLVGAPSTNAPTPHGLYVVESERPKIRWKDESVLEPYRLGVRRRSNATPRQTLLATTRSGGLVGSIVENDAATGERLAEYRADDGASFVWFAVSNQTPTGDSNVVAIAADESSNSASFVGLGADGTPLWKTPIDWEESGQMERVVSGDVDGDGVDEWLVASPNGVVRFFRATGEPFDVFQFGAEIFGVCVARWNGVPHLIVADAERLSAWRVEPRTRPRR